VTIGNILDKVHINLVTPDLIKEFLSASMVNKYPKFEMMIEGIKETTGGNGIVFSEGELWKNKRKLMSKVFNFELVKENISKIT
jgi:cytochrome P450